MKTWRIVSSAGVDLGTYEANTEDEALDAMSRAAGYADYLEASRIGCHSPEDEVEPFDGTITEVAS